MIQKNDDQDQQPSPADEEYESNDDYSSDEDINTQYEDDLEVLEFESNFSKKRNRKYEGINSTKTVGSWLSIVPDLIKGFINSFHCDDLTCSYCSIHISRDSCIYKCNKCIIKKVYCCNCIKIHEHFFNGSHELGK